MTCTTRNDTDVCLRMSEVVSNTASWRWERRQPLVDLRSREFARGEATLDDGHVVTYTFVPGDVEAVLAERLCTYPSLASLNHVRGLFPGQVLWLTPNSDSPWVPRFNPLAAEAGSAQIPYQNAITAVSLAVDAGDVETVRAIWNDTLADIFTDPATIEAIRRWSTQGAATRCASSSHEFAEPAADARSRCRVVRPTEWPVRVPDGD